MMNILTKDELLAKPFEDPRPHVVILGAGASYAAIPEGDKYQNKIPLMNQLANIIDDPMKNVIQNTEPLDGNFEEKISRLRKTGKANRQLSEIKNQIEKYFNKLELPDTATIYDYLVLGLRPNDVIATFNWDPFLIQAYKRNQDICKLPDIRFLHGCVCFSTCPDHDLLGRPSEICPICHQELIKGNLIFPDDEKNYDNDPIITRDWEVVKTKLQQAFQLTIFGYSGPDTDHKAKDLLKYNWSQTPLYNYLHVEIIDIEDPNILYEKWFNFFPNCHNKKFKYFIESSIAMWPRRTAEWKHAASSQGRPAERIGPCCTSSLSVLQDFIKKISSYEE